MSIVRFIYNVIKRKNHENILRPIKALAEVVILPPRVPSIAVAQNAAKFCCRDH